MDSLNDNEELTIEDDQYDSLEALIEEEVTKFIDTFFAKELKDTEEKLDFIEEYSLFVPLKNYFLGINIFQKIYRQLKLIDGSFASSTLVKLEREINFLYSEYSCAAKVLLGAIIRAGLPVSFIIFAIVKVLPDPVTPNRV
jgi:hypothetical protein